MNKFFGRKPKVLAGLETDPNVKVSGTYKGCYDLLNKSLNICRSHCLILR